MYGGHFFFKYLFKNKREWGNVNVFTDYFQMLLFNKIKCDKILVINTSKALKNSSFFSFRHVRSNVVFVVNIKRIKTIYAEKITFLLLAFGTSSLKYSENRCISYTNFHIFGHTMLIMSHHK